MLHFSEALYVSDILRLLGIYNQTLKQKTFQRNIRTFFEQLYLDEKEDIVLKDIDYAQHEAYAFLRADDLCIASDGGAVLIRFPSYKGTQWGSSLIESALVRAITNLDYVEYVDFCLLKDSETDFIVKRYTKNENLESYLIGMANALWVENKIVR